MGTDGIKVDKNCVEEKPLKGPGCDKVKDPKCEDTATEIKKPEIPVSEETKKKLEEEAKAKREAEEKKKAAGGSATDNKTEVDPFKVIDGIKGDDTSKTEKVGNQTVFDPKDF